MFGKMHVIKKYSRISRFLLLRQDYSHIWKSFKVKIFNIFVIASAAAAAAVVVVVCK